MHNETHDKTDQLYDDHANAQQALLEKLQDAQTPGFVAEFDPAEAEQLGAVREDAISEDDAMESTVDHPNADSAG